MATLIDFDNNNSIKLEKEISTSDQLVILAKVYQHGIGVPRNIEKAKELYQKACILGNSEGMRELANIYVGSFTLSKPYLRYQYNIISKLYEEAIANGNVNAIDDYIEYLMKFGYYIDYDYFQNLYKSAVERGNTDALIGLTTTTYINEGSLEKPIAIYNQAIPLGNLSAFIELGQLYLDNNMYQEAIIIHKQAIEKGNTCAMADLVAIYKKRGNLEEAFELCKTAVEKGIAKAMIQFPEICKTLGKTQLFIEYYIKYYYYNIDTYDLKNVIDLSQEFVQWHPKLHKVWPCENKQTINNNIVLLLLISRYRRLTKNPKVEYFVQGVILNVIGRYCELEKKIK
jgi:TPR repeat protein